MKLFDKFKKKESSILVSKSPSTDENAVFDWISGEEVGEIRKTVTNKEDKIIAYELKYLAGNIIQHSSDQLAATEEGYILLPIWLRDAKSSCDRLVDSKKRLDELKNMLEKNAISLETFTEMAKITFNMGLVTQSEKSIVEVDREISELKKEKMKLEQEIYSLDIKRRVGILGRVDYAKASLEMTNAYKRALAHIEETEKLRANLVNTLNRIKKMEEIPEEEAEKMRDREYEIHFTL